MPKMKTHKGASKRFRITKKGKLKHFNAGHSHMQSGKRPKRRRGLRKPSLLAPEHAGRVAKLLGVRMVSPEPTPPQNPEKKAAEVKAAEAKAAARKAAKK